MNRTLRLTINPSETFSTQLIEITSSNEGKKGNWKQSSYRIDPARHRGETELDWILIREGGGGGGRVEAENIDRAFYRIHGFPLIGNFHVEQKWKLVGVRAPCARRIAGSSIDLHSPRASCSFQLSIHTLQDIASFRITIARNPLPWQGM